MVLTAPHKELIGKTVLVKGTLFHAFTAHHHTDVLMDVHSIRRDPEDPAPGKVAYPKSENSPMKEEDVTFRRSSKN